jgi:hypothetical protein
MRAERDALEVKSEPRVELLDHHTRSALDSLGANASLEEAQRDPQVSTRARPKCETRTSGVQHDGTLGWDSLLAGQRRLALPTGSDRRAARLASVGQQAGQEPGSAR